jgi:hypothetical protein
MPQTPLIFKTVTCQACGAIIALIPEGGLIYTSHFRCVFCKQIRTIKVAKNLETPQGMCYNKAVTTEGPA